jgi:hypothetical protein
VYYEQTDAEIREPRQDRRPQDRPAQDGRCRYLCAYPQGASGCDEEGIGGGAGTAGEGPEDQMLIWDWIITLTVAAVVGIYWYFWDEDRK